MSGGFQTLVKLAIRTPNIRDSLATYPQIKAATPHRKKSPLKKWISHHLKEGESAVLPVDRAVVPDPAVPLGPHVLVGVEDG